jgi:hypothetical protein
MSVTKIMWFAVLVVFGAVTAATTEGFAQQRRAFGSRDKSRRAVAPSQIRP